MALSSVKDIYKSFGSVKAVNGASFSVERGELFGLLGPNGAGKTTTIRILLDIFKPERGNVSILGGEMTAEKKERIGYMPEERGLYQDIPLERCLVYMGTLKGLAKSEAQKLKTRLKTKGYLAYSLPAASGQNQTRILIGAYESREAAENLAEQLRKDGFDPKIGLR